MCKFFDNVGKWFEGAGKSVINWSGFNDMRNFFEGRYLKFSTS